MATPGLAETITVFLASARQPVLFEPGAPQIPLNPDNHSVADQNGRVLLQAWADGISFTRRVTAVLRSEAGFLELEVQRFGQKPGSCSLLDLASPRNSQRTRREIRRTFRERFGQFLHRQFPGWQIDSLTTEPDLQHSLSPCFPRALLTRNRQAWAAIGADYGANSPDAILTFGLIWLAYLRQRKPKLTIPGLILLLPAGEELTTQFRLRVLAECTEFRLYVHDAEGNERPIEVGDCGNFETVVDDLRGMAPPEAFPNGQLLARLRRMPSVSTVPLRQGALSLRVHGLEFARWSPEKLVFGLETKNQAHASHVLEIESLVSELSRLRGPEARDRKNPLWLRAPEARFEAVIREHLRQLDATLLPGPIYGQVPVMTGREGGLIDLLACDEDGRLAVLELKSEEDIHLPLQALDYWMRVRWHAARGEFGGMGYFPGHTVRNVAPRLLLIAPALHFHPASETLLRFFPPLIEVERIGIGADWQLKPRVMFRLRQAERPQAEADNKDEGEWYGSSDASTDTRRDNEPESCGGSGGSGAPGASGFDGVE